MPRFVPAPQERQSTALPMPFSISGLAAPPPAVRGLPHTVVGGDDGPDALGMPPLESSVDPAQSAARVQRMQGAASAAPKMETASPTPIQEFDAFSFEATAAGAGSVPEYDCLHRLLIPLQCFIELTTEAKDVIHVSDATSAHFRAHGIAPPILWIDKCSEHFGLKVVAHEGRHRCAWLLQQGFRDAIVFVVLDSNAPRFTPGIKIEGECRDDGRAIVFKHPRLGEPGNELWTASAFSLDNGGDHAATHVTSDTCCGRSSEAATAGVSAATPQTPQPGRKGFIAAAVTSDSTCMRDEKHLPRRTAKALLAVRELSIDPPGLMPGAHLAVDKDSDGLRNALTAWASLQSNKGCGFDLHKCSSIRCTSTAGPKLHFKCKSNQLCGWKAVYELTTDGWVLWSLKNGEMADGEKHDHEMYTNVAQSSLTRCGMYIPDALQPEWIMLQRTHEPAATVNRILEERAAALGLRPSWDYKYIYDQHKPSSAENVMDASDFIGALKSRSRLSSLEWDTHTTVDGNLDAAIVELEGGREEWARGGKCNVVSFDPTHGTNRHDMKLCCFTTVSSTGQTVVLAMGLVSSESEPSLTWLFQRFQRTFCVPPAVIATDGCPTIRASLRKMQADVWKDVKHVLCIFHVSKNFYEHIHPVYSGKHKEWCAAHDEFWRISKLTDEKDRGGFAAEWQALVGRVQADVGAGDKQDAAISWLTELGGRATQFAYCFTWDICTFGLHATQRAEAMQASLKRVLSRSSSLVALLDAVELYNRTSQQRRDVVEYRRAFRHLNMSRAAPPFIAALQPLITPFAYNLVLSQFQQALQYHDNDNAVVRSTPASEMPRIYDADGEVQGFECDVDCGVTDSSPRYATCDDCSCQWSKNIGGLPCRHILFRLMYANMQGTTSPYDITLINTKWLMLSDKRSEELMRELNAQSTPDELEANGPALSTTRADFQPLVSASLAILQQLGSLSSVNAKVIVQAASAVAEHLRTDGYAPLDLSGAAKTTPADENSLREILGFTLKTCPLPELDSTLLNMHIVYKWGPRTRGGWALGKVVRHVNDDEALPMRISIGEAVANFVVYFPCDKWQDPLALQVQNYASGPDAQKHTWMLVELDDTLPVPSEVANPVNQRKQGRPQANRLAPSHGPTSKTSKKRKGPAKESA